MKKYLLGFLLLLAFLQPMVVNVLVSNGQGHPLHTLAFKSPVKKAPATKSFGLDNVILDIDDDDEFSENEVNENDSKDYFLKSQYCLGYYNKDNSVHSEKATINITHSNRPLFILWSVFRI